jgi:tetratricopeptide (TPR) repeat protein
MTPSRIRTLWVSALTIVCLSLGSPALAQNGTLTGRVVDAERRTTDRDGKPLAGRQDRADFQIGLSEATVTLQFKGEPPRKFEVLTDANGEWYKSGLPPGTYDITVWREWRDPVPGRAVKPVVFRAKLEGFVVKPGSKTAVPIMAALTEEAIAAGRRPPVVSNLSPAEAAAANKKNADIEEFFKEADAALAASKYPEAVAAFMKAAEKVEKCAICFVKIGEVHVKAKDLKAAEEAFLKAIEFDDKSADPYRQLAALYNTQKRFDEAAKMGARANELLGSTSGGGDAGSLYNQGAIMWNSGNIEAARVEFEKAVKADPKHAKAQYYLGLSTYNLSSTGKTKLIDAKAPFEAYLKLEPNGEFAETAKALLSTIK